MGDNKKPINTSRRGFFSSLISGNENDTAKPAEKVKMLTADGKLVEVDKSLLEQATKRFKASKKDIFNWMNNPSKENS